MKKGLIFLTCVVVIIVGAYLAHIAYVGNVLQKSYESFINDNKFLELKQSNFNKGFFHSSADLSFKLKNDYLFVKLFESNEFNAKIEFINNFFTSESIKIHLFNANFPSNELLNVALLKKSFEKNTHFVALLGEVLPYKNGQFRSKNYKLSGILDENFSLLELNYSGDMSVEEENLAINFIGTNDEYIFNEGVDLSDFMRGFNPATLRSHYDKIVLSSEGSEIVLNDINTSSKSSLSENKEFLKGEVDTKIAQISSDALNLSDINASFTFDNVSISSLEKAFDVAEEVSNDELKTWLDDFSLDNPRIDIQNLSFAFEKNIIEIKGFASLFAGGSELKFELKTSENLSDSFPVLNLFGLNRYFMEKDGHFISDIHFLMKDKQMSLKINGEEGLPSSKYSTELVSPEIIPNPNYEANSIMPKLTPNKELNLPFFKPDVTPEPNITEDLNASAVPDLNSSSEEGIEKFLRQESSPQSATLEK